MGAALAVGRQQQADALGGGPGRHALQPLRQQRRRAALHQHRQLRLIQQGQHPRVLLPLQQHPVFFRPLAQVLEPFRHHGAMGLSAGAAHRPGQHRGGPRRHRALLGPIHQVAEFVLLGLQVGGVVLAGVHHQGHAVLHLQAVAPQAGNLAGVVGDQAQAMNPQVAEDLGTDAVVAQVRREAQAFVGLHRVEAAVLQGVGPQLVDQADPTPLLAQVHHNPFTGGVDHAQRRLQLGPAITAQ